MNVSQITTGVLYMKAKTENGNWLKNGSHNITSLTY